MAIAAGHLLVLWLVLLLSGIAASPRPRDKTFIAIDVSQVEKPDAPAKPAVRVPVPEIQAQIVLPSTVTFDAAAAADGSGVGQGCGMAIVLAKAITERPDAMAAVAALPDDVRSETDAVMLWNGAWLDTGQAQPFSFWQFLPIVPSENPVAALKQVVLATLADVPPDCRDVESVGPQFIPIPETGRTTMLVIGSGLWRWSSLLEPEVDPSALPATAQSAGNGLFGRAPTGN